MLLTFKPPSICVRSPLSPKSFMGQPQLMVRASRFSDWRQKVGWKPLWKESSDPCKGASTAPQLILQLISYSQMRDERCKCGRCFTREPKIYGCLRLEPLRVSADISVAIHYVMNPMASQPPSELPRDKTRTLSHALTRKWVKALVRVLLEQPADWCALSPANSAVPGLDRLCFLARQNTTTWTSLDSISDPRNSTNLQKNSIFNPWFTQ